MKLFYTLFLLLTIPIVFFGQVGDCKCVEEDQISICHFTLDEYAPFNENVQHNLDGNFMKYNLLPKLLNTKNFSYEGISDCEMLIKPIVGLKDKKQLIAESCDIFFIGSFFIDTLTKTINSEMTSIPNRVLNIVKDWSDDCHKNLTIVSQEEATPWGYNIQNENVNPNVAISEPGIFSIFSGRFGNLKQFYQGGSYQGVITEYPNTGFIVLAQDGSDRATVMYDVATEDFILGDIGILCGNGPGAISSGGEIDPNNSNDILAANLFDLGCRLSKGTIFKENPILKCIEDFYIRPNGAYAYDEGIYQDSFKTFLGCDSIVVTILSNYPPDGSLFSKNQCKGDGSSFVVGEVTYNELNQNGLQNFINKYGCDSLILIDLKYYPTSEVSVDFTKCANSGFEYKVGNDIYSYTNPTGKSKIKNRYNCDSFVNVVINYIELDKTTISEIICKDQTFSYDEVGYQPDSIYNIVKRGSDDCDSLITLQIKSYPLPDIDIDTSVKVRQYQKYEFNNSAQNNLDYEWTTDEDFSCFDCLNPSFKPKKYPPSFFLQITDEYFCNYNFEIIPEYVCQPIFPNVFNPQSINNSFFELKNDCPINMLLFQIFDKNGNLVYTNKNEPKWDGTINGKYVLAGVYTFVLKVNSEDGIQHIVGDVTVIY